MNNPAASYDALVRYYDAENAGFTGDFSAYAMLSERFGSRVLDIGCGTGRIAFHLLRQGAHVTGVDLSLGMLERARTRAEKQGFTEERLKLIEGDVRTLQLGETFDMVLFTYNTFMHFHTMQEQLAVLNAVSSHLEKGGGVVIDMPNPVEMFSADDSAAVTLERTFTDPLTGNLVMQQSVSVLDRAEQVMEVTWIYDQVAQVGEVSRLVVPVSLRYVFAHEMRLLLALAGFKTVELYGSYDFDDYDDNSPRLFVVAGK